MKKEKDEKHLIEEDSELNGITITTIDVSKKSSCSC